MAKEILVPLKLVQQQSLPAVIPWGFLFYNNNLWKGSSDWLNWIRLLDSTNERVWVVRLVNRKATVKVSKWLTKNSRIFISAQPNLANKYLHQWLVWFAFKSKNRTDMFVKRKSNPQSVIITDFYFWREITDLYNPIGIGEIDFQSDTFTIESSSRDCIVARRVEEAVF